MITIALDALVLMVLLKTINDEDIGIGTSLFISFVASIGTTILAYVLASALGIIGVLVAGVIGAALLGVAVSSMFGVVIKRAFLIGGIFMVMHILISVGISLMFLS